jgi:predicted CoA-binding protein
MQPAITEFLAQRRIAVVGVSRNRGFGNAVFKKLAECGYETVPINANADTVEGARCFRSLAKLPAPVDAVVTVVPPSQTPGLVEECAVLGIRHIWMQQGSESKEAIEKAAALGLNAVHHACLLMYADPRGIHRLHRWVHDRFGRV